MGAAVDTDPMHTSFQPVAHPIGFPGKKSKMHVLHAADMVIAIDYKDAGQRSSDGNNVLFYNVKMDLA